MRIFQCAPVNDIKCNLVVRIGKCAPVKSLLASNLPNNNAKYCSLNTVEYYEMPLNTAKYCINTAKYRGARTGGTGSAIASPIILEISR